MQALRRTLSLTAAAAALAFAAAPAAHAQAAKPAATTAAPAAPAAPVVVIDAEKQKLIDQVLALLHPENFVLSTVDGIANNAMQEANLVLRKQGMTQEQLDKAMKDIGGDVKQFVDKATPVATASAKKNASPALSPILAQNLSNDELRQVIALLQSPVRVKFEKLFPQLQQSLTQKVAGDVGPQLNADIGDLNKSVSTKIQAAATVK